MRGWLHVEGLREALNGLVARHEALRASFSAEDGKPVQTIRRDAQLPFNVLDWRNENRAAHGAGLEQYLVHEAYRPFDLQDDLPFRASLIRVADEEHLLLLCTHHIASDAWSSQILARDLESLYAAYSNGEPPPAPSTGSCVEYVQRQREWLRSPAFEQQLSYWKRQLEGLPDTLDLPADFPNPPQPDHRGDAVSAHVPPTVCQALSGIAAGERSTLFMLLLAAFELLLGRLSGQDDLAVGVPIAGRTGKESENMVGFFVNTLVLRASLSGGIRFRELLRRVRGTALSAYDYQELPFERLVEELGVERGLSRNPLFEVLLNFTGLAEGPLTLDGLSVTREELPERFSKFPITLYLSRRQGGLDLRLVYQRARFTPARMACLLRQYLFLLEQIAADPDRFADSYSLVTPETRSLLPDPEAELPQPVQTPVTLLFSRAAELFAGNAAVSQGGRSWTYSDLYGRAALLAGQLLQLGLEPGDVVVVTGPPSFGTIASIIGVLLAGGVILPVSVDLPSRRKETMRGEGGGKWLLIAGPDQETFPPHGISAIRIDADDGSMKDPPQRPFTSALPVIDADAPAYIFFTSGTTGVPKGVLGSHKGLSHFLGWQRETFAVNAADRVAHLTNISFDVALRDIFLPLTCGATLCLPAGDDAAPEQVLAFLARELITILHCVPTLARIWLDCAQDGIVPEALRWVLFAGEPLTGELTRRWRTHLPPSGRMANLYGPTETTLVKTCYMVPENAPEGILPVGLLLPQAQALVMAGGTRLCGIGELGEVAIRTPFRTLGYINAPDENRKRFMANPYRRDQNDVLYWTGDRGRYLPDGSLALAGRVDDQVKVRGVRIEPSEIAATLAGHDGVSACFVGPVEDERGDLTLAAYVVPKQPCTAGELTSFLARRLPPAMVPAHLVFLDRLPVGANGKVDRKALPDPVSVPRADRLVMVAPRTPVEVRLAMIWSEVLHVDGIGVTESFFHAGGNSLRAVQVLARIRRSWSVDLPLRRIFETPTIAELASAVEEAIRDQEQLAALLAEVEGLTESPQ